MSGLSFSLLSVIFLCCVTWYLTKDDISCTIEKAEKSNVNGFYAAIGGMYFKRKYNISFVPDAFELIDMHRINRLVDGKGVPTIMFSKQAWTIATDFNRKVLYVNNPTNPENYIDRPPEDNWKRSKSATETNSSLVVSSCKGSLQESQPLANNRSRSNIGQLMAMPVTTSLLLLIFYVAYVLYANRVDVSEVAYSYDGVMVRNEVLRIITATLSHVDLLHLAFNTMSLYQLGLALEGSQYSSTVFLYSNVYLIFLTIIVETAMIHVLIHGYQRVELASHLSIGFSGVLFAWMVAASVRMNQYCPIFLFPSLCFDTYRIPLPDLFSSSSLVTSLPVNLGPFVLLLVTKLIIPRSSFLGHLSGIIVGYPLAWNALNWLTPPVLACLLSGAYLAKEWQLYGFLCTYTPSPNLAEFVPAGSLRRYSLLKVAGYAVVALNVAAIFAQCFTFGIGQRMVRNIAAVFVTRALEARRLSFTSSSGAADSAYIKFMGCTLVLIQVVAYYDLGNLTALAVDLDLLKGNGLSSDYLRLCLTIGSLLVAGEIAFVVLLILTMWEMPAAAAWMTCLRLDRAGIERDLKRLGLNQLCSPATAMFSGSSYRLSGSASPSSSGGVAMTPMAVSGRPAQATAASGVGRGSYASVRSSSPSQGGRGPVDV